MAVLSDGWCRSCLAVRVFFTEIPGFRNLNIHSVLGLALLKVGVVGEALLEELLGIGNGPVLEEIIRSLSKSVGLTVVNKHGTLIDDRCLSEVLLWVHQSVQSSQYH